MFSVRLTKARLINVKNVEDGTLSFKSPRGFNKASLLGLYGQNGSGKTALIEALGLLKYVMSGTQVPSGFADLISSGKNYSQFEYNFEIFTGSFNYEVIYSFKTRVEKLEHGSQKTGQDSDFRRVEIFDEILKFASKGEHHLRMSEVVNTDSQLPFGPKSKYEELLGTAKEIQTDLIVEKRLASELSRSFIFSTKFILSLGKEAKRESASTAERPLIQDVVLVLATLSNYARAYLFVIGTKELNLTSFELLQLHATYKRITVSVSFNLSGPTMIREEFLESFRSSIRGMNIVLSQIIPGMTIDMVDLGPQLNSKGEKVILVELLSRRGTQAIPLRCESEGIKKIVSVLQLLIFVFNQPYVTVAIDEIDSGIFEYLLGEILKIIAEQGKGQLIFTSHNLRPLETIDKEFIAFTTTDPSNRYIRLTGVKASNNLRDFYFRKILLGGGSKSIYNPTSDAEIAFAMREAMGVDNGQAEG